MAANTSFFKQISIYFEGNSAVVGPNLFISGLTECSWFNSTDDYFNINITETWRFMTSG